MDPGSHNDVPVDWLYEYRLDEGNGSLKGVFYTAYRNYGFYLRLVLIPKWIFF